MISLCPELEPIAGSVLSSLSALRCLVWNLRTLSEIPELVGRTQTGAFRSLLLCPYSAPPGNCTGAGDFTRSFGRLQPPLATAGDASTPCIPKCSVLSRSVSAQSSSLGPSYYGVSLVEVVQDIGGPPAIGHRQGRFPLR